MAPSNFDWFLHTMLFNHTRHVLEKQEQRKNIGVDHADDSEEDNSDEEVN